MYQFEKQMHVTNTPEYGWAIIERSHECYFCGFDEYQVPLFSINNRLVFHSGNDADRVLKLLRWLPTDILVTAIYGKNTESDDFVDRLDNIVNKVWSNRL